MPDFATFTFTFPSSVWKRTLEEKTETVIQFGNTMWPPNSYVVQTHGGRLTAA